MALTTCHNCGTSVSAAAKSCPQCGAKGKAFTGRLGSLAIIGRGFLILFGFVIVMSFYAATQKTAGAVSGSTKTSKDDANKLHREKLALAAVKSVRAVLRNPDSMVLETVLVDEEGDIACITYRAQNGFGGMNRDQIVFTPQGGGESRTVWNKFCAHKELYDLTSSTQFMLDHFN